MAAYSASPKYLSSRIQPVWTVREAIPSAMIQARQIIQYLRPTGEIKSYSNSDAASERGDSHLNHQLAPTAHHYRSCPRLPPCPTSQPFPKLPQCPRSPPYPM